MTARDHDGLWEPVERFTLFAVAVIAAASGLLWATVHLAGRLFGAGTPHLAAGDLPGVLARMPDHLNDPRQAFPPDAAASLPGPLGMYSSLTLILSITVAVLLVVSRRVGRSRPEAGARLAVRRDLRGLTARRPAPGRITLGRLGTRIVVTEARHSLLVIGPPQTGKTTALAIPAILEWPGPVLVTSSKTDVLECRQRLNLDPPRTVESGPT